MRRYYDDLEGANSCAIHNAINAKMQTLRVIRKGSGYEVTDDPVAVSDIVSTAAFKPVPNSPHCTSPESN